MDDAIKLNDLKQLRNLNKSYYETAEAVFLSRFGGLHKIYTDNTMKLEKVDK